MRRTLRLAWLESTPRTWLRLACGIGAFALSCAIDIEIYAEPPPSQSAGSSSEAFSFFESKIRPVLVEHCYECHAVAAKSIKGGLRVDTRTAIRQGGDSGPSIVVGKPEESILISALTYQDDIKMPPKRKLPDSVVKDFEQWIREGAVDPREESPASITNAVAAAPSTINIESGRQFWAFQTPKRHTPPAVKETSWPRQPLDAFVLAKLEAQRLPHAKPAEFRTLVRRLSIDLTGLPPTPEEVEALASDPSEVGYVAFVDRLLDSPSFGERWARLWLDVTRFAEDQAHIVGNDASLTYPNAYLYRDWVVNALNADMPYDRFLTLQIAADLVEPSDPTNLAALGFIGLGPKYYSRNTPAVMADEWEDRVDVVGRGVLGLTLACARCHDHKFDPIPTADYYALAGVFASTEMYNKPRAAKDEKNPNGQAKQPKNAMHIVREGKIQDLSIFIRGDVKSKGPTAPRHFPAVLCEGTPELFSKSQSGRKELAEHLTAKSNPLTARVIVNRIWAAYFGRGLVATSSNFGQLGERPSHPELLDDLARRFMDQGWSLKRLHREIVLSASYRQASQVDASTRELDEENLWLGRMPRRRLSVEAWRDAVLANAGRLERSVGGPSINPLDPKATRRTIYSEVSRLDLNKLLALFDFPDPNVSADRRQETTTPLQKLFLLNSEFMISQAGALAQRVMSERPGTAPEVNAPRIAWAYQLLFCRDPQPAEMALGLKYLERAEGQSTERWTSYAQALLSSNELLYLD